MIRRLVGHDIIEVQTTLEYRPYDHLILRNPRGRTVWTVLDSEQEDGR